MLEYSKSILYSLILLFLLDNPSKTIAQTVGFNTLLDFSATALENFKSAIAINQNQIYFIANNNNLYCYDKDTYKLLYAKELKSKTNTKPFFVNNNLFVTTIIDYNGWQLVGYDLKSKT